jgi:hypothetical protein
VSAGRSGGAGLYIDLECEIPGVDAVSINGRALLASLEALNTLAGEGGAVPLARFVRAHMSELAGFADDGCGSRVGDRWFDPGEGLAAVRRVIERARRAPAVPDAAVDDLARLEQVLEAASRHGVAFHLFVD